MLLLLLQLLLMELLLVRGYRSVMTHCRAVTSDTHLGGKLRGHVRNGLRAGPEMALCLLSLFSLVWSGGGSNLRGWLSV